MDDLDLGATIRGFSAGQKAFNRYTLRKILGRGGMGVVWLARDEELEIDVALKFLPEIVAMDKESVGELKRETRRNLGLTHPHIVRVYDFVQGPTAVAISMEYVDGASLASLKLEQPGHVFAPEQLLPWTEQLCAALDYAHRSVQIVHRDLKPANLMVNTRGELKVTDFGIARSVADSVSRVSKQAGSSGTPLYMSPQQMMGDDPAVPDDIYSLGATLYELLTGKPPFHTGNIIAQVQGKVPAPVNERRAALDIKTAAVPEVWEKVIAAALAKERADRPQGAKEFMQRLTAKPGAVQAAVKPVATVEVKPSTLRYDAGGPTPAWKGKPAVGRYAGAALGVLLLLGLGYYFGIHAPGQQRLAAEQTRLAEAAREAAQLRQAEQARRAAQAAEQVRQAELKKQADQAEQARRQEAARLAAEQQRLADEKREIAAADQARETTLTEARTRLRAFVQSGDPAGFAEFERGLSGLLTRLDPDRRRAFDAEIQQAGREALDLAKRIELAQISARSAWVEVKRAADEVRQKAQGASDVQEDIRKYFLFVATAAEKGMVFKDKPTGREFNLLRRGFYMPGVATGSADTALLVAYGGAGSRLSIDGGSPQDVVGAWDKLSAGPHRLVIEQAGREPMERMVNVTAGQLLFLPSVTTAQEKRTPTAQPVQGSASMGTAPEDVIDQAEARQRGEAPVARVRQPPQYPVSMERAEITGMVVVQFIVSTTGDVVFAEVIQSSHRGFENAALNAVVKWKFRPGRVDGRAVNVRLQQTIKFNLEDAPARKSP